VSEIPDLALMRSREMCDDPTVCSFCRLLDYAEDLIDVLRRARAAIQSAERGHPEHLADALVHIEEVLPKVRV
jgi:hypothetical protein